MSRRLARRSSPEPARAPRPISTPARSSRREQTLLHRDLGLPDERAGQPAAGRASSSPTAPCRPTAAEEADVILLNSCSVREKAEQKAYSRLGEYRLLKQERPGLVIGFCGCVAQQEGEAALGRVRELDFVLGTGRVGELRANRGRGARGPPHRRHRLPRGPALRPRRHQPRRQPQGNDHGGRGLRPALHVLHRAADARPRAQPAARSDPRRGTATGGARASSRSSCSARPSTTGGGAAPRARPTTSPICSTRWRRCPACGVCASSPRTRSTSTIGWWRASARTRTSVRTSTCRCSREATRCCDGWAAATPRTSIAASPLRLRAARARPGALDRRHRRVPRRDRRRLPRHARADRGAALRGAVRVQVLAATRDRGAATGRRGRRRRSPIDACSRCSRCSRGSSSSSTESSKGASSRCW